MKGTRFALGLLAAGLLTACGGGGGGGSSAPSQTTNTQITGTASKGVLNNAIITAYAVNNGSKGNALGSTRTGADGRYSLTLNGYNGPILVELTTDASTLMKCDAPAGCGSTAFGSPTTPATGFTLQSVVAQSGGTVQAAITPFTHLAAQYAASKSGGLSSTNIGSALTQVADLFDLPPLTSTQPVDITATNLGRDINAQRYAVLNAAIAQLAGNADQIDDKLAALATELKNRDGQLLGNTDAANTIDLADILDAARDVAGSSAVQGKLDRLVNVLITENLTNAIALGSNTTSASGTSSGSSTDLDKVKGFVSQAHDLAASVLQADNDIVTAEIQDKLSAITLLQEQNHTDRELAKLGEALRAANVLMLHLEAGAANTMDATQANYFLADLYANEDRHVTAGQNFSAIVDTDTGIVTLNGDLIVSFQQHCHESGCSGTLVSGGDDISFTASNIRLSVPTYANASTQFTFGVANGGSLEGPSLRLNLSQSTNSKLTLTYPTTDSLAAHLNALTDNDDNNDLAHIPLRIELLLNRATLTATKAQDGDFNTLTGTLRLVFEKADTSLINDLPGTAKWPLPTFFSAAGTFSSTAGDMTEASISLDLDEDTQRQFIASPNAGYVRAALYNVTYDAQNDTATVSTAEGHRFLNAVNWQPYDQVRISKYDSGQCTTLILEGLHDGKQVFGEGLWHRSGPCLPSNITLGEAIAGEDPLSLYWYIGILVNQEGGYIPHVGGNLTTGSLGGTLLWSEEVITQDPTHFAKGAFSATLKLKLGGSANLNTEVSVSGHRTSFTGGDIAIKLANNGKWLQVAATGSDLTTATSLTLSNQDGATVTIVPQHLGDDDDSNDEVELKLNGTTYGKLYQLAGAWVAKFNDNSFTLL